MKKALEVAGYQGEKVVFMVATDQPVPNALSNAAFDMLKRVGMNVDYQATDWGTVVQRRASTKPPTEGGWNLFVTGFAGLDFFSPARACRHLRALARTTADDSHLQVASR
jgi:peptide/nickel transport system substrate-binding protein